MGEITELFSRRNKKRTDYPMFSVTNSRGFVNQQEQFEEREMKGEDIAAYKIVSSGEFAYNPARINVGSIARYDGETDCMISSLYVCFKAKKELVDSQLLLHILKSPKMLFNYGINGEGGVRIYLFYPNFARIRVKLPSIEEQQKIASFLNLIEERIQVQNKVIEKYESLIKALCHNLIISSNGTVCHIGDILKIGSGKDYKHLTAGSIPVFGTGGYMLSVSDWLYDGESVCIGRKGTINNPFYVDGKFWTVDTLFYTYDFEGILPKYCYYLFQTIDWLQYNEASGVPSLSKSTIERIQISIPSIDEQAKAIQILDRVEMAITCWRKLLNHDESIKQYLLSQLFI